MRKYLAGVVALAVAAPLAISGCSSTTSSGAGDTKFVGGDSAVTIVPAAKRGRPVDLSGTTLAGQKLDIATLRGKPVVLNVWGSWCAPCRKEAPALQTAADTLKAGGVSMVGINIRDLDPAPALAFEKAFRITYPSLADPDGSLLLALRGAVSPSAIPTTLVLDADGRVAARINGPTTTTTLVDLVRDVSAKA